MQILRRKCTSPQVDEKSDRLAIGGGGVAMKRMIHPMAMAAAIVAASHELRTSLSRIGQGSSFAYRVPAAEQERHYQERFENWLPTTHRRLMRSGLRHVRRDCGFGCFGGVECCSGRQRWSTQQP